MKKYIPASPAEVMLIELALGEYNKIVQIAEEQKKNRLASIVDSHPESKLYSFEAVDGKLCLCYDGLEDKVTEESTGPQLVSSVPPVASKKPNKTRAL